MRHELPRLCEGCDDNELRRVMMLLRVDGRCWEWLSRPVQVQITEIVKAYRFDRSDIAQVAASLEIDELRPLFSERVSEFNGDEKEVLYGLSPHPSFIDDAIQQYASAKSFRSAEHLFEKMIRPFVSNFRSANVNAVLDNARANGQIYCAGGTPPKWPSFSSKPSIYWRKRAVIGVHFSLTQLRNMT